MLKFMKKQQEQRSSNTQLTTDQDHTTTSNTEATIHLLLQHNQCKRKQMCPWPTPKLAGIAESPGLDNISAKLAKTLHILQELEDESDTKTCSEDPPSPEQTFHTAPTTPVAEPTK